MRTARLIALAAALAASVPAVSVADPLVPVSAETWSDGGPEGVRTMLERCAGLYIGLAATSTEAGGDPEGARVWADLGKSALASEISLAEELGTDPESARAAATAVRDAYVERWDDARLSRPDDWMDDDTRADMATCEAFADWAPREAE